MRKWKKTILIYGILYVVIVIGLFLYKWLSIPAELTTREQVENEEKLIKELKKGVPDMVYPLFITEKFEQEDVIFEIEKSYRNPFAPASGYMVFGNMMIGDLQCRVSIGASMNDYIPEYWTYEYRGVQGFYKKIENSNSGGSFEFAIDGQRYWIDCIHQRGKGSGVTPERAVVINNYILQLGQQMIDMKLDGDTIGK